MVSEFRQSKPSGLFLPIRAGIRGEFRWQVLDERGVPEVPRSPSGFSLAPPEGVIQPNLITDHGMDRLSTMDIFTVAPNSTAAWRRRLAVGTSSTEPDDADTALGNEVQRDATSGSFSNGGTSYALDTDTDVFRAVSSVIRLVTMTDDRNLTEIGLAQDASNDIHIHELLRDGGGNPITVSLLNGKTLRVDHSAIVEIAAPSAGTSGVLDLEKYDAANTLEDTIAFDVIYGPRVQSATEQGDLAWVFNVWNPSSVNTHAIRRVTSAIGYSRAGSISQIDPNANSSGITTGLALGSYTPGTHERLKRVTVQTGALNAAWFGYMFSSSTSGNFSANRCGFMVMFDDPASYTKVNTDTMRVGLLTSWARA